MYQPHRQRRLHPPAPETLRSTQASRVAAVNVDGISSALATSVRDPDRVFALAANAASALAA